MQRPVMDPQFADFEAAAPRQANRVSLARRALGAGHWVVGLLLVDVACWRRKSACLDQRGPFYRLAHTLLCRLTLFPLLIMGLVLLCVHLGTHPPRLQTGADPQALGVYYDPVVLNSADGTTLQGWLVPVLDAQRVLSDGDQVLHQRHPAVVLVHDHGQSHTQMLPLVKPLHEAGLVVLAISLRGSGASDTAACTFGLNEANDVRAALDMLRRRSFVDPRRLAVLGVGTGANAALLAADSANPVAALVLDAPVRSFDGILYEHLSPRGRPWAPLRPLCRWVFETAYGVQADQLDQTTWSSRLADRPALIFGADSAAKSCLTKSGTAQSVAFLRTQLKTQPVISTAQ